LVSIDAPLGLPLGRISPCDDDPGRKKYGITRQCDRLLLKMGIRGYPSLIPSMQGLTERGMGIAKKLRKRGIPVIECFPGAAKTVWGMPRKKKTGKDISLFRKRLLRFGVKGDLANAASHELDAAVAALIGAFYLKGRFIALGNKKEGFLIVPTREKSPAETVTARAHL
jgi:predicted nuclease with RNAse H fold